LRAQSCMCTNAMQDIIHETTVNEREGTYAWHGRHKVIMDIVANHKFFDTRKRFDLFSQVIDAISATYDIEIRTLRALCNIDTGLPAIMDKEQQNILLCKMISAAPSERVPRHGLLRNLIDMDQFDQAETELRMFQQDFKLDGAAVRYRIVLATARAIRAPGLMREDRTVLLEKARDIAVAAVSRYRHNKTILIAYCEVGIETAKLIGSHGVFDTAIAELKLAEDRLADPNVSSTISRLERRMYNITTEAPELTEALLEDE
jgi:hypothetical protein